MNGIALITGAGGGVGRAVAQALAASGFDLVLAGRRRDALDQTGETLGHPYLAVSCDVTDPASVSSLFEKIKARKGRLDLLFNNAGMDVPGIAIEDVAFDDWSRVLATNLTGQFLCAQAAFRLMKAQSPQGGRIVNNGSIAAHSPRPNSIPYSASKHGVSGLTKGLMIEGRPYGIAVSQIDIGNASAEPESDRAPSLQASGERRIEPFMHFDNVGRAVAFIASMPAGANVPFLTVMATNMPFIGRG